MAGWHHWLDGRESEWTPGVGDGQGGLACCDSWGRQESDTTEQLIWSDLISILLSGKWRKNVFYIFNWLGKKLQNKNHVLEPISKRIIRTLFTILPIIAFVLQSQSSWDRKPKPQKLRLSSSMGSLGKKLANPWYKAKMTIFMFFRRARKKMSINYQMWKWDQPTTFVTRLPTLCALIQKTFTELHTMKWIIWCFKPLVTRSVDVLRL